VAQYFAMEEDPKTPHTRVYHSRIHLLDAGYQRQVGMKGVEYLQMSDGRVAPISPVLKAVLDMEGVACAELRAYELTLTKSPVFDWGEIEVQFVPLWLGIQTAVRETNPEEIEQTRRTLAQSGPRVWV